MEPKPIVVVYLPEQLNEGGAKVNWGTCNDLSRQFDESRSDYYWFFLPDYDAKKVEFKVFHIKDFTPIQHEELKKMIEEKIKPTP